MRLKKQNDAKKRPRFGHSIYAGVNLKESQGVLVFGSKYVHIFCSFLLSSD